MTALSQRAGVTQLEFHQAMNDFKTMFPEMDEDVIEVVLRSNNGAVDATIDQLLFMNQDAENERLRTELDATENEEVPPRYSPATPPPSYQQAVPPITRSTQPKQTHDSYPHQHQPLDLTRVTNNLADMAMAAKPDLLCSTAMSRAKERWKPPLLGPLPPTFLRVEPDENQRKLLAASYMRQRSTDSADSNNSHWHQFSLPQAANDQVDTAVAVANRHEMPAPFPMSRAIHRWKPPLVGQLPANFLRLTESDDSLPSSPSSTNHDRKRSEKEKKKFFKLPDQIKKRKKHSLTSLPT